LIESKDSRTDILYSAELLINSGDQMTQLLSESSLEDNKKGTYELRLFSLMHDIDPIKLLSTRQFSRLDLESVNITEYQLDLVLEDIKHIFDKEQIFEPDVYPTLMKDYDLSNKKRNIGNRMFKFYYTTVKFLKKFDFSPIDVSDFDEDCYELMKYIYTNMLFSIHSTEYGDSTLQNIGDEDLPIFNQYSKDSQDENSNVNVTIRALNQVEYKPSLTLEMFINSLKYCSVMYFAFVRRLSATEGNHNG